MALINKVSRKMRMNQWDIVCFQLTVYCYIKNIHISRHDLSCLTLLGITGEVTLEDFCTLTKTSEIFSSNQSARNSLAKVEKKNLIIKNGKNKKRIFLNPELNIQTSGNIMLDYTIVRAEPVTHQVLESQES